MNNPRWNVLVGLTAAVAVLGIGWWGYTELIASRPPVPGKASPEEVAAFLSHPQGLIRLTVQEREAYLHRTFDHLSSEESRSRLGRCLRRMSDQQRQNLVEAIFGVVRVRMLEAADRFNRLPQHQRDDLVRTVISDFRHLLGEPVASEKDAPLEQAFRGLIAASGQDWNQLLVTRTTPEERARAGPLAMAIAQQLQEEKEARRKKRLSASPPAPRSRPAAAAETGDDDQQAARTSAPA